MKGNNLIYFGEILRGEFYEDILSFSDINCCVFFLFRDLFINVFIEV